MSRTMQNTNRKMIFFQFIYIVTIYEFATAFSSNDLGLQLSPPPNSHYGKNKNKNRGPSTSLDMTGDSPYKPSASGKLGANLPPATGPASAMAGAMLGSMIPGATGALAGSALQSIGKAASANSNFDTRNKEYVNPLGMPCKDINSKFCQLSTTTTTTTFPIGPLERKRKERLEIEEEERARESKTRVAELNRNPYVDGWFGESIEDENIGAKTAENKNIHHNEEEATENKFEYTDAHDHNHNHNDSKRADRKRLRKRPMPETQQGKVKPAHRGLQNSVQNAPPVPMAYQMPYQMPTLHQLPHSQAVVYRGPVQRAFGGLFGMQAPAAPSYPSMVPVNSIPTVAQNQQQAMNIARQEMSKARTQNTQLRWEGFNKAHETTLNLAQQTPQMLHDNRQDILRGAYGVAKNKLQVPQSQVPQYQVPQPGQPQYHVPQTGHPQHQIPQTGHQIPQAGHQIPQAGHQIPQAGHQIPQFMPQQPQPHFPLQQGIRPEAANFQQPLTQLPYLQAPQNYRPAAPNKTQNTNTGTGTPKPNNESAQVKDVNMNESLHGAQAPSPNNDILSKLGIPLYDNGADRIMHGSLTSSMSGNENTA